MLVLVARLTDGGKLSQAHPHEREMAFVERALILRAWSRNPDLKNVSGLGVPRSLTIPGLFNTSPGAPSEGAQLLRAILGIR